MLPWLYVSAAQATHTSPVPGLWRCPAGQNPWVSRRRSEVEISLSRTNEAEISAWTKEAVEISLSRSDEAEISAWAWTEISSKEKRTTIILAMILLVGLYRITTFREGKGSLAAIAEASGMW